MEEFSVHILGCGSANPMQKHRPASQVLSTRGKLFMVDCGEGTQTRLARQGLGIGRLGHIFLSHEHGDHCFGLPGLVNTMGLLGRTAQLHIHAPQSLEPFVSFVTSHLCHEAGYEIVFHSLDPREYTLIYEDRRLEAWSLPLRHGVPCCGYLFREKLGARHIRREMIDAFGIPVCHINGIKEGADWTLPDGTVIPNKRLTTDPTPPRSWAYVSDTSFEPRLSEWLEGVDLLFHEATFSAQDELRAKQTCHSTSTQAATIAKRAGVRKLCIGHYSSRLKDEQELLREAQEVFPNTVLADEGLRLSIGED